MELACLYRLEAENCRAERFIRLVAARCVHVAGKTDTHHRVTFGPQLKFCVATHVCVCVYLCSVNYAHTFRSVANEPLNVAPVPRVDFSILVVIQLFHSVSSCPYRKDGLFVDTDLQQSEGLVPRD